MRANQGEILFENPANERSRTTRWIFTIPSGAMWDRHERRWIIERLDVLP